MGLRIQNNITAMTAHRNLQISDAGLSKSLERLSSGYRINSAKDDAAGLAVSSGMRADIASYKVAQRNASEANSLLQVAEGSYDQISNILTRLKELATQGASANASGNATDIQNEVATLLGEIDRIADATEYGGTALLGGYGVTADAAGTTGIYDTAATMAAAGVVSVSANGVTNGTTYTVAVNADDTVTLTNDADGTSETLDVAAGAQTLNFADQGITIVTNSDFGGTTAAGNELDGALKYAVNGGTFIVGNADNAQSKITVNITAVSAAALSINTVTGTAVGDLDLISAAIDTLASSRGKLGAAMNQLGYAVANLSTSIENIQAAESVIRDVDMAAEMTSFTKNQILMQAGTAMLAQANMAPQNLLSLFGG
jgi:flagellin